jgi:hypothetical protein
MTLWLLCCSNFEGGVLATNRSNEEEIRSNSNPKREGLPPAVETDTARRVLSESSTRSGNLPGKFTIPV